MQGAPGGGCSRGRGACRQMSPAVSWSLGGTVVAKGNTPVSHSRIQLSGGRPPWKFPTVHDEPLRCLLSGRGARATRTAVPVARPPGL